MDLLWSCLRAFPIILLFINLINYIITSDNQMIYETLLIYLSDSTNFLFKYIFKNIYQFLDVKYIPLLGIGSRPNNATECDWFLGKNNVIAKSFGMPSGHSQFAWTFATFYILKIYYIQKMRIKVNMNKNNMNKNNIFNVSTSLKIILLLLIGIISSYARVEIENCHTTNQVIVGGIIGIIMGRILFKYIYNK